RKKAEPGLANIGTHSPKRSSVMALRAQRLAGAIQAGDNAFGELQDVAANDRLGALGLARTQRGQDRPVAFGDLLERELSCPQAADQRPALGVQALPGLDQSA